MTNFASQLKKLRTERNLSQDAIAQELYISRQAISKWENSEAAPDMDNLVRLAEIFDVSLDQLVLGKEPEILLERIVEKREIDIKKIIKVFWVIFANLLLAVFLLLVFYALLDCFALTSFWR